MSSKLILKLFVTLCHAMLNFTIIVHVSYAPIHIPKKVPDYDHYVIGDFTNGYD